MNPIPSSPDDQPLAELSHAPQPLPVVTLTFLEFAGSAEEAHAAACAIRLICREAIQAQKRHIPQAFKLEVRLS